jgi:peptidoglycan/LPS O-acetylase OafA/YrhL
LFEHSRNSSLLYENIRMQHPSSTSDTKAYFYVLDGLRGVAAIVVVLFHFMEIIFPDFSANILAHGFLAVDFFFCLSGFVIAHAYDARVTNISLGTFFKNRFVRLHPLVVFGAVLGLLAFLFTPLGNTVSHYSAWQIIVLFFTTALLIPYPTMEDRYFNLFALNAPAWSLFWEYIASVLYIVVLVKLPRVILLGLTFISAIVLVYVANRAGNLLGGWNGETFWHGGARMLFSFSMGMCVYRYQWRIRNNVGFVGLSILLLLAFFVPYSETYNWITEPLIVMLYFPLIIALGAGTVEHAGQAAICKLSGEISYPLYITHYFVMWIFGSYYSTYQPTSYTLVFIVASFLIIQLGVAYGALRFFDVPVRNWLKK